MMLEKKECSSLLYMSIAFSFLSCILFAPHLRYDSLVYIETARSIVFDRDLNTYNENCFFTSPGWTDVTQREFFKEKSTFATFMTTPPYTPMGYKHVFFPMGNTVFWLPAFYISKSLFAAIPILNQGFQNNGYTYPYHVILTYWNVLFFAIGLVTAFKIVSSYFDERIAVLSTIIMIGSGNLLPFIVIDPLFSHGIDFFLINTFIWIWISLRNDQTKSLYFLSGIISGMLIIVRYQDIIFLLVPAIEFIARLLSRNTEERKSLFYDSLRFLLGCILVLGIQSVYWKIVFGKGFLTTFEMGTSGLPTFKLTDNQMVQMLFSTFHGQLSWMPMQALGLIGFLLFAARNKRFEKTVLAVFIIEVFYNSCRMEWWNLGFGVRRFSGFGILLILGYAFLIKVVPWGAVKKVFHGFGTIAVIWNIAFMMLFYDAEFDKSWKVKLRDLTGVVEPYQPPIFQWVGPKPEAASLMGKAVMKWSRENSCVISPLTRFFTGGWHLHDVALSIFYASSISLLIFSGIRYGNRFLVYRNPVLISGLAVGWILLGYVSLLTSANSVGDCLALTNSILPKKPVLSFLKKKKDAVYWGENCPINSSNNISEFHLDRPIRSSSLNVLILSKNSGFSEYHPGRVTVKNRDGMFQEYEVAPGPLKSNWDEIDISSLGINSDLGYRIFRWSVDLPTNTGKIDRLTIESPDSIAWIFVSFWVEGDFTDQ